MTSPAPRAAIYVRRAAIYVRVSTDKQETEEQEEAVRRYVAAQGWALIAFVKDEGRSGRKDRPAHEEIVRAAERREVDVVVYSRVSRAHRSLQHWTRDWQRLRAAGVRVVYVLDGLDSNGPFAQGIATIMAELAEMQAAEYGAIQRRRAAGKRARAEATGERLRWGQGRILTTEDREWAERLRTAYDASWREVGAFLGVSHEAARRLVVNGPTPVWTPAIASAPEAVNAARPLTEEGKA